MVKSSKMFHCNTKMQLCLMRILGSSEPVCNVSREGLYGIMQFMFVQP